jgi:hypothetical protein
VSGRSRRDRDPLLPRPVVVGIALVVAAVWAITAIAVLFVSPAQSGALLAVSSLMAMVLGAAFGVGGNLLKKNPPADSEDDDKDKTGSGTP